MIRPETASDTVDLSGYSSGFNYHNNNSGNRRYVNSNSRYNKGCKSTDQRQPQTLLVLSATTAVSTITTTTQAIEDTLTLTADTTAKGANQQTRDSLRYCCLSGYYSGFNYHNNNPGNRRYVNSNSRYNKGCKSTDQRQPQTLLVFQATTAVSTITTTTQAIEDTLTLTAATTKGANDQTRDSLRHCWSFRQLQRFQLSQQQPRQSKIR